MKRLITLSLLLCVTVLRAQDNYQPGPDSLPQEGVPKGELLRFSFNSSKIFPGTVREYSIYVPAQYTPDKPACLWVNQDGPTPQFSANIVFDNLIHKKELPVIIAVSIGHGRVVAPTTNALDRMNRSFEYDGLGDNYVRFLNEELLPDAQTKKTSDGRAIRFSQDANDRGIGGSSSGAIAAFTAAWERPDSFSRVFSSIGTYVGLRGGQDYSTLLRKYEPKPIRIFLQSGTNDNNLYAGDWWMANQMMERSFTFSGYEVNHEWGTGGHNGRHATAIFPDAMRWLWKDYPQPVKNGPTNNTFLTAMLAPGEGWKLVGQGYGLTQGTAANSKGEVFFNDVNNSKSYKIGLDGKVTAFLEDSKKAIGQEFGPDGQLYVVVPGEQRIVAYDAGGKATTITDGIRGHDLTVAHNGNIYVTNPPTTASTEPSNLYLVKPNGEKKLVDTGIVSGGGVTISPDQTLLYVADHRSHWVYSFQIQPDGTLANKQQYGHLHVPDWADKSGAFGTRVDKDGRIYVATYMGVQVLDQLGRVNCILPAPGNVRVNNLCFGGEDFRTLFIACGDKIYSRKLKVQGNPAWNEASKPGAPRL